MPLPRRFGTNTQTGFWIAGASVEAIQKPPADSYVVHMGFWGTHETSEGVYLTNPCVLAGDGRARNKDGTPYLVPPQELEAIQWPVGENNWSEW
jgi:hypothetical protein